MSVSGIGIVMFVLGLAGRLWVGRREFYRRNMAGVEGFKGYTQAVGVKLMEKAISLIASLLLLGGAIFLIIFFGARYVTKG